MIVTMLGDEQTRARAGETVWRVEHDGREAIISHLHSEAARNERVGGAWYAIAVVGLCAVRVRSQDFTAAVNVSSALLSGGAL